MQTFTLRAVVVAAALALLACGEPKAGPLAPNVIALANAVSFEACPMGSNERTLTIQNTGTAAGTVSYAINGSGRNFFSIVEETKVDRLAPGASATIGIRFKPVAAGVVSAQLEVDDGSDETEPLRITLSGTGSSLEPLPQLDIYRRAPDDREWAACQRSGDGQIDACTVKFDRTVFGDATFEKVTLRNEGCAPLTVIGIAIGAVAGRPVHFFVAEPAVPPTPESPVIVPGAGGEFSINVRFEPTELPGDEGPGIRSASLRVDTDSENSPVSALTLLGQAEAPAGSVAPTFCDFTAEVPEGATPCWVFEAALGKKVFTFRIHNGGDESINVGSIGFREPSSGRFALGPVGSTGVPRNPEGKAIPPGGSATVDVVYGEGTLYVTDVVEIVGKTESGATAGRLEVRVSGGVRPNIEVIPDPTLDFSSPPDCPEQPVLVLPLQICNAPNSGDLEVHGLSIQQHGPFFQVLNPPASNTILKAEECLSVDVQFTRSTAGGLQVATLSIASNDPDYPFGKKVNSSRSSR